jgi:hypothetical protein
MSVFFVRYDPRLQEKLNIKHILQRSTAKWQQSYSIKALIEVRVGKRRIKKAVEVARKYEGGLHHGSIVEQFLSLAIDGSAQL